MILWNQLEKIMDDSVMNYAEAVKTLRKKMILSQMEFADYLGGFVWHGQQMGETSHRRKRS